MEAPAIIEDLLIRWEETKTEMLDAELQITMATSAFFNEGKPTSKAVRAKMDERLARAKLRNNEAKIEIHKAKILAKRLKHDSFINYLVGELNAKGMSDVVEKAREESAQSLKDSGLYEVYKL